MQVRALPIRKLWQQLLPPADAAPRRITTCLSRLTPCIPYSLSVHHARVTAGLIRPCRKCFEEKPSSDFAGDKSKIDGLHDTCQVGARTLSPCGDCWWLDCFRVSWRRTVGYAHPRCGERAGAPAAAARPTECVLPDDLPPPGPVPRRRARPSASLSGEKRCKRPPSRNKGVHATSRCPPAYVKRCCLFCIHAGGGRSSSGATGILRTRCPLRAVKPCAGTAACCRCKQVSVFGRSRLQPFWLPVRAANIQILRWKVRMTAAVSCVFGPAHTHAASVQLFIAVTGDCHAFCTQMSLRLRTFKWNVEAVRRNRDQADHGSMGLWWLVTRSTAWSTSTRGNRPFIPSASTPACLACRKCQ